MATKTRAESAETILKWVGALVALGGLLWAVTNGLFLARIQAETHELEVRQPFLNRQLALYQEATENAAILATSTVQADLDKAKQRFWELYWGELAMVENGGIASENGGVEGAMVRFGKCLNGDCPKDKDLKHLALDLAHTCRDSLAVSWGVPDWKAPTYSK